MSLQRTKEQLIHLLTQEDIRVIAVSGKWGTGKTHLWNEVKEESGDEKVREALYVSLFGLSSVDQIKRKLIEASIPYVESHGGMFDGLKHLFKVGMKAASDHYKALAAFNDINLLLMAPIVLQSKFIVIDDIERKHDKLGIDEVLGFIDEYSQQHGSRFILVLNDDKLSTKDDQKALWASFREKVIDQEIVLSTSATEAFSIAIKLSPSIYAEAIKKSSITCALTNIRVVIKIIKVTNQILANRTLDETIQARVVPSIVLFSAIHYRGLHDGPDFKFALNVGNPNWDLPSEDRDDTPTAEEAREDGWRMLMQELDIHACDEFEQLLVDFLESGLIDAAGIESVIARYAVEQDAFSARTAARNFIKSFVWDHRIDEAQLEVQAAKFCEIAAHLDPITVTELHSTISMLPNGVSIGDALIDNWVLAYRENESSEGNYDNPFDCPIHHKIQAEFDTINATAQANETVVEACRYIIENNTWGTLQEVALRRATAVDFEAAIRGIEDIDELRRFMRQMIKMCLSRATYDPYFGSATERFIEACQAITQDKTSGRLSGVIQRSFVGTSIASELSPESPVAST